MVYDIDEPPPPKKYIRGKFHYQVSVWISVGRAGNGHLENAQIKTPQNAAMGKAHVGKYKTFSLTMLKRLAYHSIIHATVNLIITNQKNKRNRRNHYQQTPEKITNREMAIRET